MVLLVATSCLTLLLIKPANAQSIPKPPLPQFSLWYSDTVTIIPATVTSTTNPYSGKNTTTTIPAQQIENKEINVTITNQPFPPTVNGYTANLYFIVQDKPHFQNGGFEQESYYYFPINTTSAISGTLAANSGFSLPPKSSGQTTILQFPTYSLNPGDEEDFQVKAILGYYYTTQVNIGGQTIPVYVNESLFAYQTSDWSPTQTFTMPSTSTPPPSNISTPAPSRISSYELVIIILVVVIIGLVATLVAVVFRYLKNLRSKQIKPFSASTNN